MVFGAKLLMFLKHVRHLLNQERRSNINLTKSLLLSPPVGNGPRWYQQLLFFQTIRDYSDQLFTLNPSFDHILQGLVPRAGLEPRPGKGKGI
ncbi:hypothetical protein Peur_004233 [Populus x canadensis]